MRAQPSGAPAQRLGRGQVRGPRLAGAPGQALERGQGQHLQRAHGQLGGDGKRRVERPELVDLCRAAGQQERGRGDGGGRQGRVRPFEQVGLHRVARRAFGAAPTASQTRTAFSSRTTRPCARRAAARAATPCSRRGSRRKTRSKAMTAAPRCASSSTRQAWKRPRQPIERGRLAQRLEPAEAGRAAPQRLGPGVLGRGQARAAGPGSRGRSGPRPPRPAPAGTRADGRAS